MKNHGYDLLAVQETRAKVDRVSSFRGITRFVAASSLGQGGVELWVNPDGPLAEAGCGPLNADAFPCPCFEFYLVGAGLWSPAPTMHVCNCLCSTEWTGSYRHQCMVGRLLKNSGTLQRQRHCHHGGLQRPCWLCWNFWHQLSWMGAWKPCRRKSPDPDRCTWPDTPCDLQPFAQWTFVNFQVSVRRSVQGRLHWSAFVMGCRHSELHCRLWVWSAFWRLWSLCCGFRLGVLGSAKFWCFSPTTGTLWPQEGQR